MVDLMKPRLTFLLGGARSGKSAHAETLIAALPSPWVYIATAEILDEEMSRRIKQHQKRRDHHWQTIEAPLELEQALSHVPARTPVLIDCLTLWLSNQLLQQGKLSQECQGLVDTLSSPTGPWFVVANETGLGIVPDNALARRFRDEAGQLNQRVAALADEVILMAAGIPIQVKKQ